MPDPNLGASVVAARGFLTTVHNQLAQLLEALDAQLSDLWVPTNPNVTSRVGAALNAKRWMASYLYRFYFPKLESARSNRIVGVIVFLNPPEGWSEAPLLGFAARFGAPQSHNDIWSAWNGPAQAIATVLTQTTEVPEKARKGFLPKASAFRGVALPVFSLTGPDDLRERVTNVLLRADEELGTCTPRLRI
jgi:hypothetical protein